MEEDKSFKRFLIIWIIIVIIIIGVPIINIILVSEGWLLRIFGSSGTKVIDGKTYVEVTELEWMEDTKVTYYSEHNKYVFKKDENNYIIEYFDFNGQKPNRRYYYENGQIIRSIKFDQKGNIIEFDTDSLTEVLTKKSKTYIVSNNNLIENMYKYYAESISPIEEIPQEITLNEVINKYDYYAPGNENNSKNYRYFIDKYLIKDDISIRIISQTENQDIIIKDVFYFKDLDKVYVITDTTRDEKLPEDCRVLTLSQYDVIKETLNDKNELQLFAYNNENNKEMCLIDNLEK